MTDLRLQRIGLVMKPEAGNPMETEGILNPAAVRGPDGHLYLFPRLVAKGNYSRIGIARVRFDEAGDPIGADRLGIALEPEADYELRPGGGGGCEDPRITFVEPLQRFVMAYTAFSSNGPRIALALSKDLFHWERLGLASFHSYDCIEFEGIDNKDATVFPVAIRDPAGKPALAILHRPLFPGTRPEEKVCHPVSRKADLQMESIWISYCPIDMNDAPYHLGHFTSHNRLAHPVATWERLKIGCGTPPILTRHGWLIIYHGVGDTTVKNPEVLELRYSAGLMILSDENPRLVRYRSPEPVLIPGSRQELHGFHSNIVFPTGIDRRDDLGSPDRFDVYFGMGDNRIGAARLDLPAHLSPEEHADILGPIDNGSRSS